MPRRTGSTARTTNGTATMAWPSGTSHHEARQSIGPLVERDEHAEPDRDRRSRDGQHHRGVERGGLSLRALAIAIAASVPTATATAVDTTIAWNDVHSDSRGSIPVDSPGRTSARPRRAPRAQAVPVPGPQRAFDQRREWGRHDERGERDHEANEPALRSVHRRLPPAAGAQRQRPARASLEERAHGDDSGHEGELQHRQGCRRADVPELGRLTPDLDLERGTAHAAEHADHAERGEREDEHDARRRPECRRDGRKRDLPEHAPRRRPERRRCCLAVARGGGRARRRPCGRRPRC